MGHKTAFRPADILIPKNADMTRWACVACDQYTSDRDYWEKASEFVGDAPSALRLILPEVYLNDKDVGERIENTHKKMEEYLSRDMFTEYRDSFIYVRRTDSVGKVREGIVGMIDLEEYDYSKGSTTPVRATEATVPERIPPRLKIRNGAPLELPHIMILIDDPEKTVIEPLAEKSLETVYDFDLYGKGGHIEGRLVDKQSADRVEDALCAIGEKESFEKRTGLPGYPVLLYAMGDGNHSLATAKAYYEQKKAEGTLKENDPARYALCEIVNLHSPALEFEAIHRIVTGMEPDKLFNDYFADPMGLGSADKVSPDMRITLADAEGEKEYGITTPTSNLAVGCVQPAIDEAVKDGAEVDYIHGREVVTELAKKGGTGIILPDMPKSALFPAVMMRGSLPRKTFSMGHADDKRYYVEARRIT